MTPFLGWYRAGSGQALCDRILDGYDVPAGSGRCGLGSGEITDLWTFPSRAATLLAASLVVAFLAPREPGRFQLARAIAVAVLVVAGIRGVIDHPGFGEEIRDTYAPQLGAWVALVLALAAGALWLSGEVGRLRAR